MRWIELDNAVNVRDLGDLPTETGGVTLTGRLVRADNLQDLSPADVDHLVDKLGLTTVIDLRSHAEVRAEGPGPLTEVDSVEHRHLSVLPESDGMTDVAGDALMVDRRTAYDPDDPVCSFYLGYLVDRPDSIVDALHAVAAAPGAAIVHCAAGKDRTGVVVALALTAVGVHRDAVVADYAASAERIGAVLKRLRSTPTYRDDVNRRPDGEHRPRPETMARFLHRLDEDHGGVRRWLADRGFGDAEVRWLSRKLLGTA